MYQFKIPHAKKGAQGNGRSSSRGDAARPAATPAPSVEDNMRMSRPVPATPNNNDRHRHVAAPHNHHASTSQEHAKASQRHGQNVQNVACDMAAWKEAMRTERQQRLTQSQQKRTMGRQPLQSRNPERIGAPPPTSLSLSEYRDAVLATRSATDVISNTHASRSASQMSMTPRHRLASHATPISIPHKRIDPLDVQFRPARSVVRQFMQEPTPFFVRKNQYGILDGYVDQAASTSYRLQDAASSPTAAHVRESFVRDEPPLRDVKERPAAWRQNTSAKLYDFPTPRSTLLRNSYINERHLRPAPSPTQRSVSVGDASPRFSLAQLHDHARLSARDRRLMGAPSPQAQRLVPQSVSDRLISPHHNGSHDLPVRRDAAASGWGDGDDASLDMDLDPVPLSFAPSPVSRQAREAVHPPRGGARPTMVAGDASPQQQRKGLQRAPEHLAANNHQPPPVTSSWSPAGDRGSHPVFASPRSPEERDPEPSPGVDVSPPTPSHPPRQGFSPVASPQHRESVEAPTSGSSHRVPPTTRHVAPVQNLLQQLALPSMRTQRSDLFQGHSAVTTRTHHEDTAPEGSGPSAANLRHSARHDKLERELMESQRRSPQYQDPYFAQSKSRGDRPVMSENNTDGLSSSRVLLQQLATKRVPR